MRYILISCFVLLLTACNTLTTPERFYSEGNYVAGIYAIADITESKDANSLSNNDKQRMQTLVNKAMAYYENRITQSAINDYQTRIDSYYSLLLMKKRLSGHFYSASLLLNNKYSEEQLNQVIAKEYYLYAQSFPDKGADSNLMQAQLYEKGLSFANYKDSQRLYAAADKKYRVSHATETYNKAQAVVKTAKMRHQYREAALLYQEAARVYKPLGKYKDAAILAERYWPKGIVKVYVDSTGFSSSVLTQLSANYIEFVENAKQSDVVVAVFIGEPESQQSSEKQNNYNVGINVRASGAITYKNAHSLIKYVREYQPLYLDYGWEYRHGNGRRFPRHFGYYGAYFPYERWTSYDVPNIKNRDDIEAEIRSDLETVATYISRL